MLDQVLNEIKNWFRVADDVDGIYTGTYTIENGTLALPFVLPGQYFRIVGSVLNSGLYIYGETILDGDGNEITLRDETFNGAIWALAVPKVVIDLAQEISTWQAKYGAVVNSPYSSETIPGLYSYTKPSGTTEGGEGGSSWQSVFRSRLNAWRKLRGYRS